MAELGKRSIDNFFEHRMPTYAEQLSYRGLFGLFPFIILVSRCWRCSSSTRFSTGSSKRPWARSSSRSQNR